MYKLFFHTYLKNRFQLKLILLLLGSTFLIFSCQKKIEKKIVTKNDSTEIKKILDQADQFYFDNLYDSSYAYYNKALELSDPNVHPTEYVNAMSSMADIQTIYSNYAISEQLLSKTLPYLSQIENPKYARNVYSYIAYNYYHTYDFNNALLYHKKALHLPGSSYKKSLILIDIAILYSDEKKYEEAISILKPLSEIKTLYPKDASINLQTHSNIINNLGYFYFQLNKPNALKLYKESLKINLEQKNEISLIFNYRNLSEYYQKSNPELALEYAKKSYEKACFVNSASDRANCLAQLIKTSEGNELKKYTADYITIIDSITQARRKTKNQFAQIKYNSQKDKDENLHLRTKKAENELQLERQANRSFIAYVVISFSLAILIFLSFYLFTKGKKEKNDAIYKSEMRISKKLNDELANEVYHILQFSKHNTFDLEINKEKLLDNLDSIYSKTRNISKENSLIKTDEDFPHALKELLSGYKTEKVNIILQGFDTIQWNKIDKNKKIILYRVLQELFLNMQKHSQATLVSTVFKINNKNIMVSYIDNGVGAKDHNFILKNGLQNVENRIKTIKGTITFDKNSDKGFKLSFTFPI